MHVCYKGEEKRGPSYVMGGTTADVVPDVVLLGKRTIIILPDTVEDQELLLPFVQVSGERLFRDEANYRGRLGHPLGAEPLYHLAVNPP